MEAINNVLAVVLSVVTIIGSVIGSYLLVRKTLKEARKEREEKEAKEAAEKKAEEERKKAEEADRKKAEEEAATAEMVRLQAFRAAIFAENEDILKKLSKRVDDLERDNEALKNQNTLLGDKVNELENAATKRESEHEITISSLTKRITELEISLEKALNGKKAAEEREAQARQAQMDAEDRAEKLRIDLIRAKRQNGRKI